MRSEFLISPGTLGVESEPAIPSLAARPNPFRDLTRVSFHVERAGEVAVAIYDVAGRRVRGLARSTLEPGENTVDWDGRTDAARLAGPGLYFVRVRASDRAATLRVVRIGE